MCGTVWFKQSNNHSFSKALTQEIHGQDNKHLTVGNAGLCFDILKQYLKNI